MKRDVDVKIYNMDGTDALLKQDVPLTIKHCLHEALLASTPSTTAEEKSRRWALARKINKGNLIDFTICETELIKSSSEIHPTLLYGQIYDWLESPPKDE